MTYIELKNLVNFYLHRTDMADKMDAFFELARERIGKDARLIRMQTEVALVIVEGSVAIPDDYIETKSLATTDGFPIQFQDVNNFDRFARAMRGGRGGFAYYTLRGPVFYFAPPNGTESEPASARLTYYRKPAKLVADEDVNVITEHYPTLYLFSVLAYAHNAIQDVESEMIANQNYNLELNKLNDSEAFGMSGSPTMSGI